MFRRGPLEGRWLLTHDAIPTLFDYKKKMNSGKHSLNRKTVEEKLKRIKSNLT
uniref:Uncharacterized protein n=1 Tax=Lepeophtheirus salmonis TaxID=72036 RepID=A0A0K2TF77_LEPSM